MLLINILPTKPVLQGIRILIRHITRVALQGYRPGPISSPGLSALQAVANPASGDYLFFLAGDDGVMYFAHTSAEHDANIAKYCKINCSTP
jgi:hypothetical protein